jgi:hypothetical protein
MVVTSFKSCFQFYYIFSFFRNLEIYNLIMIFLKIYVHLRGELIFIDMLLVFFFSKTHVLKFIKLVLYELFCKIIILI